MSKYIAYKITEDRNILVVDERQFTIGINIPNYLVDLYLPILGYDGIGVITMLYRFVDKQQRGPKKYKPRFNIKQYAKAGRVGYRTLDTILNKLVACQIIRVRKPEGIARRWHHHTEIILLDPPREVPGEFREEVIKRSPAQWLFAQESSDSASYEAVESDEDEVSDSNSMKLFGGNSIKHPGSNSMKLFGGNSIKSPTSTLIEASDSTSIKASERTSMLDDSTWDGKTEDAPPPSDDLPGGDGGATDAEIFLRSEGVSKKKAHQFRDYDPHAVELEWNAEIPRKGSGREDERQQRIGRLLDRWEVRPPHLAARGTESQRTSLISSDEAQRRARAIAPDATEDEIDLLTVELLEGASDDQALDWLANHRAFYGHLAARRPS